MNVIVVNWENASNENYVDVAIQSELYGRQCSVMVYRLCKYGADININIEGDKMPIYIDIANFDRYEMIIGTPFIRRNQVVLDFKNNEVIINGKQILAVTVSAKEAEMFA